MAAAINIKGHTYGLLTVIRKVNSRESGNGSIMWKCKCQCGNTTLVSSNSLRTGNTKSCGCLHKPHGDSHSDKLYVVWKNIKDRCYKPTTANYDRYGGRGIRMHKTWKRDYIAFRDYVLALPNAPKDDQRLVGADRLRRSLDRINNDGHYTPGNLKWSSAKQQARNRRTNRYVTFNGKRVVLAELCEKHGANYQLVWQRLNRDKWPLDRALGIA